MDFSVTVLGSGAAMPTHTRHCSSQVVNINGFRMLIDCGESTQGQLRLYHQRMQSMGVIFISHLHGDHIFGLPGLLSSMHLCGRTEPVQLFAPKGLKNVLQVLFDASGTRLQYELQITELEGKEPVEIFSNKHCRVTAFPLLHTVPNYGYLFEERHDLLNMRGDVRQKYQLTPDQCVLIKQGNDLTLDDGTTVPNKELTLPPKNIRRYAYCCDTAYTEEIIPVVQGVNLLCMESTFDTARADLAEAKRHCTATQSALLAQKAGVKKLMLTHFSARYPDVQSLVDEAGKIFPDVVAAEDGLQVEVPR